MYHRFHAPYECVVEQVTYIPGDTWNVNPSTLARIPKVFCKNERAIISARLESHDTVVAIVAVAAILVGSIRLNFLSFVLNMHDRGEAEIRCRAPFIKGQEIGWFEHGSTIIVFAPNGVVLCDAVREGAVIRMGQPLMRLPTPPSGCGAAAQGTTDR